MFLLGIAIFIYSPTLTQVMSARAGKFNLHLGHAPESLVPLKSPQPLDLQAAFPAEPAESAPFWLLLPSLWLTTALVLCQDVRINELSGLG